MNIQYFDEVDSTNSILKKMASEGAEHGLIVVAHRQTAGRGRMGRSWDSKADEGIFMSLLVRPDIEAYKASMLTIVAALAVREAIINVAGINCRIKWPNDLVVNGRKLCGILTEMSTTGTKADYVIIGIGINADTEGFSQELTDKATSLYIETGKKFDHKAIIEEFEKLFAGYYENFLAAGDLLSLKEEYNGCLANFNNKVKILDGEGGFTGISKGINKEGELLVVDEIGNEVVVRSGEVSVRGIYGYV